MADKTQTTIDPRFDPIIALVEDNIETKAREIYRLIEEGKFGEEDKLDLEKDPDGFYQQIFKESSDFEWQVWVKKYPDLALSYRETHEPIKKALDALSVTVTSDVPQEEAAAEEPLPESPTEPTQEEAGTEPSKEEEPSPSLEPVTYRSPHSEIFSKLQKELDEIKKGKKGRREARAYRKNPYEYRQKKKSKYEDEFWKNYERLYPEEKALIKVKPGDEISRNTYLAIEEARRKGILRRYFPRKLSVNQTLKIQEKEEDKFWEKWKGLSGEERDRYVLDSDFIIRRRASDEISSKRWFEKFKYKLSPVKAYERIYKEEEAKFWEEWRSSEKDNGIYQNPEDDSKVQHLRYQLRKETEKEIREIRRFKKGIWQKIKYSRDPVGEIAKIQSEIEERHWRQFNTQNPDQADAYVDQIDAFKRVYKVAPRKLTTLENAVKGADKRKGEVLVNALEKGGVTQLSMPEERPLMDVSALLAKTHEHAKDKGDEVLAGKVENLRDSSFYFGTSEMEKASRALALSLKAMAENNKTVYIYDSEQGTNTFAAKLLDSHVEILLKDRPDLRERIKVIRGRREYVLKTAANPNAIIVLPDTIALTKYRRQTGATILNAQEVYNDLSKRGLRGGERAEDKIYEAYLISDKKSRDDSPGQVLSYYDIPETAEVFGNFSTLGYEQSVTDFQNYLDNNDVELDSSIPINYIPAQPEKSDEEDEKKDNFAKRIFRKIVKRKVEKEMAKEIGQVPTETPKYPKMGRKALSYIGRSVRNNASNAISTAGRKIVTATGRAVTRAGARVVSAVAPIVAKGALYVAAFLGALSLLAMLLIQAFITVIIWFFGLAIVTIIILFIINSGAYIVPPGGFGQVGSPIPGNCTYGTCPLPNALITCGSLGSGHPVCEHGTNEYWDWQLCPSHSSCSTSTPRPCCSTSTVCNEWALPSSDAANCHTNQIQGSYCYSSSSSCSYYGLATDIVDSTNPDGCGSNSPVFFPYLNGLSLNWTLVWGGTFSGTNQQYGLFRASGGGDVFEIYFTHLQDRVNSGSSGQRVGNIYCFSNPDANHTHYELKVNGSYIRPDGLCSNQDPSGCTLPPTGLVDCYAPGPYGASYTPPSLVGFTDPVTGRSLQINQPILSDLNGFINTSRNNGIDITIYDGYRSYQEQLQLCLDCNARKSDTDPNNDNCLAAPAAQSQHRTGRAVDVYIYDNGNYLVVTTQVVNFANSHGFTHPYGFADPPHFYHP